jgi:hypothetical protein
MNLPLPSENPALWIGICTAIGTGIGMACRAAFLSMSPIFTAIAVLMLGWGKRAPVRLRMLQAFTGKALPESRMDPKANQQRGNESRVRRSKLRNRGMTGTSRKH